LTFYNVIGIVVSIQLNVLQKGKMKQNKNDLGSRMKDYEQRARSYLQRRSYTVIRVDGKCFSSYTRGLKKPFDEGLVEDMQLTTQFLCENIQGCKLGYTQSDEISLILTDFDNNQTDAYFDGQIQKICSVVASMATAKFNQLRLKRYAVELEGLPILAFFDARAFNLPSFTETMNYLRWRQKDAVKNSISMVAQSLYSDKQLHKKNGSEKQEMIFQKGQNWNDYPASQKRGTTVVRRPFTAISDEGDTYSRSRWEVETPDLLKDTAPEYLGEIFPDEKYTETAG